MKSLITAVLLLVMAPVGFAQGDPVESIQKIFQSQIQDLASADKMQRAFQRIADQDEQTVEEHILLTEIPAPPFAEEIRAQRFLEMLSKHGVDSIWIDEVGNVIGYKKGTEGGRVVALDAHLDTVFPQETDVKVRTKGDTLFAPGIGDDTRGLAMVLAVARAMHEEGIQTADDVLFIGTVGEEGLGDLRGVKHLFSGDLKIDSWISIDGGAIGRVNNKGLGSYRYRVSFNGPGGHSWGAFGLANPHHALGDAIRRFVSEADIFTNSGPKTSYNIGRIGGGTSVNSIPFESWMEIDTRSIEPSKLDSLEIILHRAVTKATDDQNKIRRLGAELTSKIEKIGLRPSGEHPEDLPLVQRAIAATAFFGKRARLTRGSTNSNIPIALGVPAVTIGRGGKGAGAHSLDEWWINDEGHKATQLALLLLLAEAGLGE